LVVGAFVAVAIAGAIINKDNTVPKKKQIEKSLKE
jgi:hypothetical protein